MKVADSGVGCKHRGGNRRFLVQRRERYWHVLLTQEESLQEPITGLERVQSEALPTARFFPPVSFSSTTSCLPELAIILPVPSIPTTPTNFFLPL
ncbi:hypothetical protein HBI18_143320 [Parastagonospora nodorum]|nr:hypothetical protein HBI18_143320 [Parastagonospora nodorum]